MTEIDTDGQLVQLDRFSPPSPQNHTHQISSHTPPPSVSTAAEEVPLLDELITEEQLPSHTPPSLSIAAATTDEMPLFDELISEEQCATTNTAAAGSPSTSEGRQMAKSRPDLSEVPPLNELITEEQYQSLSEMAEKMKMTLDPQLGNSVYLGEVQLHACRNKYIPY